MFGCLCFIVNLDPNKKKFDARAKKFVFLGYVPNCKGYKVYDIKNHKVLISIDIKFYEDQFPYKGIDHQLHNIPLPAIVEEHTSNYLPLQDT